MKLDIFFMWCIIIGMVSFLVDINIHQPFICKKAYPLHLFHHFLCIYTLSGWMLFFISIPLFIFWIGFLIFIISWWHILDGCFLTHSTGYICDIPKNGMLVRGFNFIPTLVRFFLKNIK